LISSHRGAPGSECRSVELNFRFSSSSSNSGGNSNHSSLFRRQLYRLHFGVQQLIVRVNAVIPGPSCEGAAPNFLRLSESEGESEEEEDEEDDEVESLSTVAAAAVPVASPPLPLRYVSSSSLRGVSCARRA